LSSRRCAACRNQGGAASIATNASCDPSQVRLTTVGSRLQSTRGAEPKGAACRGGLRGALRSGVADTAWRLSDQAEERLRERHKSCRLLARSRLRMVTRPAIRRNMTETVYIRKRALLPRSGAWSFCQGAGQSMAGRTGLATFLRMWDQARRSGDDQRSVARTAWPRSKSS
jgi:hypothetical protein